MWADHHVEFAPVSSTIPWKIPKEKYGHGRGRGKIDSFNWEIVPKEPKAEKADPYKLGQQFEPAAPPAADR
jgi:hypothetical protein